MHRIALVGLALAVLVQAGCDRADKPAAEPVVSAESTLAAPAVPAPASVTLPTGKFDAISTTAMGVTGDLTATSDGFVFSQGQAYGLVGAGKAKGADPYGATGDTLASVLGVPSTAEMKVFRVTKEDPAKARNGGFCGADPTTFIITSEGVDSGGAPALFLMAFKGAKPPSGTSAETDLCGTFMYAPSAGPPATK